MVRNTTRVQPSQDLDTALNPPGKLCAPLGIPNLTGSLNRSQSHPNMAFTLPSGWAEDIRQGNLGRSREYKDRQRNTAALSHSMTAGAWGNLSATLRPGTCAPMGPPGGGHTQGALNLRPATTDRYDISKHSWHHPLGQAESIRLCKPEQPGSHAWKMRKARDHIGYGDDGIVDRGDIQITAVSGDGPDWLVGTRTLPGPFGTKKYPVRRCPRKDIEGNEVKIRGKTYQQGPGLSTLETLHDTPKPRTPQVEPRAELPAKVATQLNKARFNNFAHGGVQTRGLYHNNVFAPSDHVTYETHNCRWVGKERLANNSKGMNRHSVRNEAVQGSFFV